MMKTAFAAAFTGMTAPAAAAEVREAIILGMCPLSDNCDHCLEAPVPADYCVSAPDDIGSLKYFCNGRNEVDVAVYRDDGCHADNKVAHLPIPLGECKDIKVPEIDLSFSVTAKECVNVTGDEKVEFSVCRDKSEQKKVQATPAKEVGIESAARPSCEDGNGNKCDELTIGADFCVPGPDDIGGFKWRCTPDWQGIEIEVYSNKECDLKLFSDKVLNDECHHVHIPHLLNFTYGANCSVYP